jgi:outer membrane immunogenic protein
MKKTTFTLAILFAATALMYAGPEPLPSGKEMKEVAPPPPPTCPNWTGFYVGGFGGYKFSNTDLNLELNGAWDTLAPVNRDVIEANAPSDLDTSGAEAGGLVGYNYQFANQLLVGVEAAGGYLWLRDSEFTGRFDVPGSISSYNVGTSFKTHYLFTFGPRIGYAWCRWLPYLTGGLALGDLDFSQRIRNLSIFPFSFGEKGSKSEDHVGWMVGGGLEYAINSHWSARAQYQYIDLGSVGFDSSGEGVLLSPPSAFTGHHEAELREHNASFAIIYKF